jgi:NAD(P)-dependent dehydrogenase (short-subunit alcohol dehydrogenase family)
MAPPWNTAWITGASSGIGRALSLALAEQGVRVAASARSADKLAELARGNERIEPYVLDVTDLAATITTVQRVAATLGPIDLAVLNAGVWEPVGGRTFSTAVLRRAMDVNYFGIAHGLEALLPHMLERGRGRIAMMSSIAGYRGLPRAAAYGPSKAAVISLAETLKADVERYGVEISVIVPGFVATPLTSGNKFPMPFLISAERAATHIVSGLQKGKFEIAFPWQMVALMKFARLLPYRAYFWYARAVHARSANKP